ncbi:MAG: dTMP kinase [Cyanobacteria bacterium P01_F01_bin.42]
MSASGKLIVFEGVEGAGKTTQIHRTLDWLENSGWSKRLAAQCQLSPVAAVTREPGGTQLGLQIRRLLLDPALSQSESITSEAELLLYAADRAQHVIQFMQPRLAAGQIVLCDRFTDSTVAYQGYGRQLDLALIEKINRLATFGLTSDLTLWFDVDVSQGLARTREREAEHAAGDRMEANDLAFHQRVQAGFSTLAQASTLIHRVNASQSLEQVTAEVVQILEGSFQRWFPHLLPNS